MSIVATLIRHVCDGYAASRACAPWASRDDLARLRLEAGPAPRCPGAAAQVLPELVARVWV